MAIAEHLAVAQRLFLRPDPPSFTHEATQTLGRGGTSCLHRLLHWPHIQDHSSAAAVTRNRNTLPNALSRAACEVLGNHSS